MKILLVEDDEKIVSFLTKGLKEEFFSVDSILNGEDGLYLAQIYQYDVIILDWMLPKLDGTQVCKRLREKKINTPILFLTAKGEVEDRIKGLDIGADDYLSKPFAFRELISRVKALIRRNNYSNEDILKINNLTFDYINRVVKRGERKIELTQKEYEILELLMKNKNNIVTITLTPRLYFL